MHFLDEVICVLLIFQSMSITLYFSACSVIDFVVVKSSIFYDILSRLKLRSTLFGDWNFEDVIMHDTLLL